MTYTALDTIPEGTIVCVRHPMGRESARFDGMVGEVVDRSGPIHCVYFGGKTWGWFFPTELEARLI